MANNTIDKKESEGSDDSMGLPEALEPLRDLAVGRKRKGGRKPVCPFSALFCLVTLLMMLQILANDAARTSIVYDGRVARRVVSPRIREY